MTAGSDIHKTDLIMGGVAFSHRLTSIQDYIETIKSREGYVLTDGVVWYDSRGTVIAPVEDEE